MIRFFYVRLFLLLGYLRTEIIASFTSHTNLEQRKFVKTYT